MNTKKCPYCHEEISEDAILCKYCHNLLTDDEEETVVFDPEDAGDERTRVFSAQSEPVKAPAPQRAPEPYGRDDYDDSAAKKTFITAAIVTFGVLLIVIIAIFAGYEIFGGKNDNDPKAPALNSSMAALDSNKEDPSAAPADASVTDSQDEDSTAPADSAEPSDSSDDTSSTPDASTPDESSKPEESTPDSSTAADESSQPAEDSSSDNVADVVPENNDNMVASITEALKAHNDSGVKSYTYRAADSAAGSAKFYYFYMNDGKAYSVAYNTKTDDIIIRG